MCESRAVRRAFYRGPSILDPALGWKGRSRRILAVRIALFWFSLAALLFTLDAIGSSPPVSGAPVLALALASFTRAKLLSNPLRRHMFGSLARLQVVLPGLLYAAALAGFILERTESASAGTAPRPR